ncbi:MAG: response regulator [Planctomycetaceae bacterium]
MQRSSWKQLRDIGRKQEERFLMLSESLPLGVFVTDLSGACQYTNKCWEGITGIDFEQSSSLCWDEALHESDRKSAYANWLDAVESLNGFEGTYRLQDGPRQDHPRWGHLRLSPTISDWGVNYVGVLEEITERIQSNEKQEQYARDLLLAKEKLEANSEQLSRLVEDLTAAKFKAEEGAQAKSEFLANMSHEIRTPMTAILGYTELLIEQTQHDPQISEQLDTIQRNGRFLLEIINDILDLSKIEAGKVIVESIPCSLTEIVRDVMELMELRARDRLLPLLVKYRGPIPETITTDPTRLRQILINLLNNAIKFTSAGSIQLVVCATDDPQAHQLLPGQWPETPTRSVSGGRSVCLLFEVIDTGIGISNEQQSHLFQPFTQADSSTSRKYGGTGLGLTISRRLALVLDGDITVKSRIGEGSNFRLRISAGVAENVPWIDPCTLHTMDFAPLQEVVPHVRPSETALAERKILLVEDGQDNQRLMTFLLKKAGAEVVAVENGQLALDAIASSQRLGSPFDLILMDMQMPVMDGYTAVRLLREQGCETPIIALTAHAMEDDRQRCLSAGCTDYSPKPFNRDALIRMAVRCIGESVRA